jgi:hypothetical protein
MTLIIPLSEIKKQDMSRVGGKAVALAFVRKYIYAACHSCH